MLAGVGVRARGVLGTSRRRRMRRFGFVVVRVRIAWVIVSRAWGRCGEVRVWWFWGCGCGCGVGLAEGEDCCCGGGGGCVADAGSGRRVGVARWVLDGTAEWRDGRFVGAAGADVGVGVGGDNRCVNPSTKANLSSCARRARSSPCFVLVSI